MSSEGAFGMEWLEQVGVFAVTFAILIVPGAIIASAARLRLAHAIGVAPLLSVAVIGLASVADHVLPLPWGVWQLLLVTAVLAALTLVARHVWWRGVRLPSLSRRMTIAAVVGVSVAAALIGTRLLSAVADPENISQTFDNVYHLNAVRWVLDEGDASPFRQLIPGFYPVSWHALVALVVQLSGASIPVATNVVAITVASVIWPISIMLLVRQLIGSAALPLLLAGIASAAFAAFPLSILDFGVLYPNFLSIAILPGIMAIALQAVGVGRAQDLPRPAAWWIAFGGAAGMTVAHPSSLITLIAIGTPAVLVYALRLLSGMRSVHTPIWRWLLVAAIWLAAAAVALLLLLRARPTFAQAIWPPTMELGQAISEVMTSSAMQRPIPWIAGGLVLTGIATLLALKRSRWAIASWAIIGLLYVVCVSFPAGTLRYGLTGTWYSDPMRLAALLPVVSAPLAAVGAYGLALAVRRFVRSRVARTVTVAALAGLLVVGSQAEPALNVATDSARASYAMTSESALLTPDELALIRRVPEKVPPGSVIAGSPWTGTSLVYAYTGRAALLPHIYSAWPDGSEPILQSLNEAAGDQRVCAAVRSLNVGFVLDFGAREVHGASNVYPGLTNLNTSDSVELVDSQGQARLYRISACG